MCDSESSTGLSKVSKNSIVHTEQLALEQLNLRLPYKSLNIQGKESVDIVT